MMMPKCANHLGAIRSGLLFALFAAGASTLSAQAVTDLAAVTQSPTRVLLTWSYSGPATHFTLERRVWPDGPFEFVKDNIGPARRDWPDSTVLPGLLYAYRIRPVVGNQPGLISSTAAKTPLSQPGSMRIVPESPNELRLLWTHDGVNSEGFEIMRRRADLPSFQIVDPSLPPEFREYIDTNLRPGESYVYKIRAKKRGGYDSSYAIGQGRVFKTPDVLLDVFPGPEPSFTGGDSEWTVTWSFRPSGSKWGSGWGEQYPYLSRINHIEPGQPAFSWNLRLGRGGQVYSLISEFGEAMPPQWRLPEQAEPEYPFDEFFAPWVDDVFQLVTQDLDIDGPEQFDNSEVHQAGSYIKDPIMTAPFYSPLLALGVVPHRSLVSVHWAQESHVPVQFSSDLIVYQKLRDLGNGIIQLDNLSYNFGNKAYDVFVAPWGGTRRSSLPVHILSNPEGSFNSEVIPSKSNSDYGVTNLEPFGNGMVSALSDTGGWAAFAASESLLSRALGVVFGFDDAEPSGQQWGPTIWRWGNAPGGSPANGEANWRNYLAAGLIRPVDLEPGMFLFTRYYFVVAPLPHMNNLIETYELADSAEYRVGGVPTSQSGVVRWFIDPQLRMLTATSQTGQSAELTLFADPVIGSRPVFYIADRSGRQFATTNPYVFSTGFRAYDGNTHFIGLLGYTLAPPFSRLLIVD